MRPAGLLDTWRLSHFASCDVTSLSANDADPDGDGVANLMEYLTSQNPKAAGGIGAGSIVGLSRDFGLDRMVADLRLLLQGGAGVQSGPSPRVPRGSRSGT